MSADEGDTIPHLSSWNKIAQQPIFTLTTHTTTFKYATKQDRLIRNVSGLDLTIACNDGVKDCT